ncbi:MAG: HNH endonuclease [Paraclostridium sp.]|uniref:HNH endonuclease n=1 Tax=Paraclostridium sp. TaxID=2023273 RepID=UPI003F407E10
MEQWQLIEEYLMLYSGFHYKKPIDKQDEMMKIKMLGMKARQNFSELGEKVVSQLSDFTRCKCSSWVNMGEVIPNYLWIQFKKKGFEECPSSISLAIRKFKEEIYFYVAIEIKDQNATEEDFKNHNQILIMPLFDKKLYYSGNGDEYFNLGKDINYAKNLVQNKKIKKIRIQKNMEKPSEIGEENTIDNIIDAIKILQPYYDKIIKNYKHGELPENIKCKSEWIISCNPSDYDVVGAFNKLEKLEWKQSTNINIGDVVYIYVSSPVQEIKYKCTVRKVNLKSSERIDDSEFVLDDSKYKDYGRYMELELINKYLDKQYNFRALKQHGLKSVQGPSRVTQELLDYIKSMEIKHIKNSLKKEYYIKDSILDKENNDIKDIENNDFYDYKYETKERKKPKIQGNVKVYPRDRKVAMNALAHAHYLCEIDETHFTFIRKNIDINYTEPHHLIPMAYSDLFEVSLDVEENIVSLCSNCHNFLHYGRDIKDTLKKLYDYRIGDLNKVGISIEFKELVKMYL